MANKDSVLVLNDQGGGVMNLSVDVTSTLRAQDHGHPPLVTGINGDVAGTLDASYYKGCGTRQGVERDVVLEPTLLESNQNHATITNDGISPCLPAAMGNGGGYVPMVVEPLMVEMTSTKNTIIDDGISCTLTARMGTGGNQVNAVLPFDTTQVTSPGNYSHPEPGDPCHPLAAGAHPPAICYGISSYESNSMKSSNPHSGIYEAETSRTLDLNGGAPSCNQGGMAVVCVGNGQLHNMSMQEVSNTLDTMHDAQAVLVPEVAHALKSKANCDFREDSETYVTQAFAQNQRDEVRDLGDVSTSISAEPGMHQQTFVSAVDCRNCVEDADVNGTLQAKSNGGWNANNNGVCRTRNTVRRLTPLECTRLQGLPDYWVNIGDFVDEDGKIHKDSDTAKYRALGNSMAKPFWFWLIRRISAQYERPATLGSLFDGIGVAPLCWEQVNGKGTAVWASEIEPFCIAVTKKHFPEPEDIKND